MAHAQQLDSLPKAALEAAGRAVGTLAARQQNDHWPSPYGGPLFLLPGLVIAHHVTSSPLGDKRIAGMTRYLSGTQNADGGWGLHVEGPSTVLGTALNLTALRLLGVPADDDRSTRARARLHALGGAEGIPTWGKFYLAVLGVYHWDGVNPLLPELWLLPRGLPTHPANLWCHTRAVFLPMSYVYGRRGVGPIDATIMELRDELFVTHYEDIKWPSLRESVGETDLYTPHSRALKVFNRALGRYGQRPSRRIRERALKKVADLIHHEDESTSYLTIGPVSKAIHMIAVWLENPEGPALQKHIERVDDYLWDGDDGILMQGYNGSQFWDVAFAMQAMIEYRGVSGASTGAVDPVLQSAHNFLDRNQVRHDVDRSKRYFRDRIAGCWPFSTAEQAWPVSDCTAEGVKVAASMQDIAERPIRVGRLHQAMDRLLESQNADGGWSEYEAARGNRWLEGLNAAEVFGDIMIGYSYPECTSACMQAMVSLLGIDSEYRKKDISRALVAGEKFLRARQNDDGSWYGGWGVCFSYGTWFGVEGLRALGAAPNDPALQKAVSYLLAQQRSDGGWGEAFESCVQKRWIDHADGQVVQTSWALLALMSASESGDKRVAAAVERGVEFVLQSQREDGGWNREALAGVFNRNCAINYDNYRFVFPLWALSRYASAAG